MTFRNVTFVEGMKLAVNGGGDTNTTFTFTAASIAGTKDSVGLTLNTVDNPATVGVVPVVTLNSESTGGIETVSVTSSGPTDYTNAVTLALTGFTTLNIDGDARLNIGQNVGGTTLTTVNASTFNNNLTAGFSAGNKTVTSGKGADVLSFLADGNVTVSTGDADDRVIMGTTLTAADTLDGQEGKADVVQVAQGLGINNLAVKNFEVLRLEAANSVSTAAAGGAVNTIQAAQVYDVARLVGSTIDTVVVKATTNTTTLSNVASGLKLVLNGQDGYTGLLNANTDVAAVTVDVKGATAAGSTNDALSIEVGRVVGPTAADLGTAVLRTGTITADGVEIISVNSAGSNAANTINAINSSTLATLNITGDDALTITNAVGGGTIRSVDASTMTGNLTLTTGNGTGAPPAGSTVNGVVVKGGNGVDTITTGVFLDQIITKGSNNVITANAGNDFIDLTGSTRDRLVYNVLVDGGDNITGFTGGGAGDVHDIVATAPAALPPFAGNFISGNGTNINLTGVGVGVANSVVANNFLSANNLNFTAATNYSNATNVIFEIESGTSTLGTLTEAAFRSQFGDAATALSPITFSAVANQGAGYVIVYTGVGPSASAAIFYVNIANAGGTTGINAADTVQLVGIFDGIGANAFTADNFI
jgi:hypothetical protein